ERHPRARGDDLPELRLVEREAGARARGQRAEALVCDRSGRRGACGSESECDNRSDDDLLRHFIPPDWLAHVYAPRRHSDLVAFDRADDLAARDLLARLDGQALDGAVAVSVHLVLHLHRLDNADDLTGLDLVPVGHTYGEDDALHRRHDGVAAARAGAS